MEEIMIISWILSIGLVYLHNSSKLYIVLKVLKILRIIAIAS